MKVVFSCHTIYQIFVAYIIKALYYNDNTETILLVEGSNNCDGVVNRSKEINDWSRVVKIDARGMSNDAIKEELRSAQLCDLDILHLGGWGGKVANILSFELKENAYCIINEEGTASYSWLKICEESVKRYLRNDFQGANLKKIKKAYLFEPRISDNQLKIKEEKLDVEKYIHFIKTSDELNKLNYVFAYDDSIIISDVVFFDQNLEAQKVVGNDYQGFLIGLISDYIGDRTVAFKQHPSESKRNKVKSHNTVIIKANETPWEICFLNEVLNRERKSSRLYFTYCSSSVFNSILFGKPLGVEVNTILLYEYVNRFSKNKILLDEDVIARYLKYYPKETIMIPQNEKELLKCIDSCLKRNHHDSNKSFEYEWLRNFYLEAFEKRIYHPKVSYKFNLSFFKGNVILYGAGNVGKALHNQLLMQPEVNLIAWCDKNYKLKQVEGLDVKNIDDLSINEDVLILVAVERENLYNEIFTELERKCINSANIKWIHPIKK